VGLIDTLFRKGRQVLGRLKSSIVPQPEPEVAIDGRLREMTGTLSRCRAHVALLQKEQRDLQLKVHRNANRVTHHLREARLSAARGDPEEAFEHLRARARHEEMAGTLEGQLAEFRQATERLEDQVRALEMRVEETKRHKQLLVAQRECLDAHLLLGNAPAHGTGSTVREMIEDLELEVGRMQIVAHASSSIPGLPCSPADLALSDEILRRRVDDELSQLKYQLALCNAEREREERERDVERPRLWEDDEIVFI
jgi:phage shock protein A